MSNNITKAIVSTHKRNTTNLRPPFKPGQSGNPKGRKKGKTLTTILREALDKTDIGGKPIPNGWTAAEYFVQIMISLACKGDPLMIKEIFNRIDGKVPNRVEIRDMSKLTDEDLLLIAHGECESV